jgi:hypothetical protein
MSSKQREVLKKAKHTLCRWQADLPVSGQVEVEDTLLKIKSALAEPIRNCDVGTAEEQNIRHGEWCRKHGIDGAMEVNCASSDMHCHLCFARWSQMPYESEVGNEG